MKRIICLILLVLMILTVLIGCAEVVSEETVEVEGVITKVDYTPMRIIGKVIMPRDYDIFVKYDNIQYEIDVDEKIYKRYRNKVGESITCYLVTHTYDDGTIKRELKIKEG